MHLPVLELATLRYCIWTCMTLQFYAYLQDNYLFTSHVTAKLFHSYSYLALPTDNTVLLSADISCVERTESASKHVSGILPDACCFTWRELRDCIHDLFWDLLHSLMIHFLHMSGYNSCPSHVRWQYDNTLFNVACLFMLSHHNLFFMCHIASF